MPPSPAASDSTSLAKMDGSAESPDDVKTCCLGGKLTPNSKALLVAMGFFSTITVAQAFAAIAANSSALLVDCVSMGIDAASYGFNVISEAWPNRDSRLAERNQLLTAGVSFGLLIGFTLKFQIEALETILAADGEDESCCDFGLPDDDGCHVDENSACANVTITDDYKSSEQVCEATVSDDEDHKCLWEGVNPYIVFIFALFGLLFDLGSLLAFKKWASQFSVLLGGEDSEALNMSSALMHVLSDCLRSTTTLIESLLIFAHMGPPSYVLDGYATLIVTTSILVGAFRAVFKWAQQLRAWVKAGNSATVSLTGNTVQ